MFKYLATAAIGALTALGAAQAVVSVDQLRHPKAAVATLNATPESQRAAVRKGKDGHYWAEADVNGRQVRFLVDTGATAVSLTSADAQTLGIDTTQLAYDYNVATADGRTRAAAVKLAQVSIAGAVVNDVDALVIENGTGSSLLGMSYLGRLSGFEATPQSLILKP
ncbi:TIGR02281 family clan AA aspartic protease [Caulobacter segnis]|uniref:TIGR02281 family clan AA aspartic protease n=1 Tax=Caulobacter segnis TaxID=88688 RepID=UPI0024105EE6|nr:TIGR02281 family clan AA aspartic protease [Caulobacter segnis]MDG2522998.1 TIGR02281 family clan AA aspartic protease [Caulobacter segnis]